MQIARLSPRDSNKWVQGVTPGAAFFNKLLVGGHAAGPGTTLGTAKLKGTFTGSMLENVLKGRLQLSRWRQTPAESSRLFEQSLSMYFPEEYDPSKNSTYKENKAWIPPIATIYEFLPCAACWAKCSACLLSFSPNKNLLSRDNPHFTDGTAEPQSPNS